MFSNWIKSYVENGYIVVEKNEVGMGNKKKKKMTPEEIRVKELEEKVLRLTFENEYFKKMDALVMERKKKESKK